MSSKFHPANLIFATGALLVLFGSLFDFIDIEYQKSGNAWNIDYLAFASTLPAILAIVALVWVVLEIVGVALPQRVITFTSAQMKTTWALSAFGFMVSLITVVSNYLEFIGLFEAGLGIGFSVMLLGTIAMMVGAFLELFEIATNPWALQSPPQPPTAPQHPGQWHPQQQYISPTPTNTPQPPSTPPAPPDQQ